MKRWLRRLAHVLIGLTVLVGLALLVLSAMLPGIARDRIHAELRRLGVRQAVFDLRSVSHEGLQVSNARLGSNEWLRARTIDFRYRADELFAGQLREIEITGAEYLVRVRGGKVDFGPERSQDSQPGIFDLPLQRITLRDSVITVESETDRWRIPVDGTLVRNGSGQFELQLVAQITEDVVASGVRASGAQASLHLALNFSKEQVQVFALEKSQIRLGTLTAGDAESQRTALKELNLTISPSRVQPLAQIAWGEQHRGAWLRGELASADPISVTSADMNATVQELSLAGAVDNPGFEGWSVQSGLKAIGAHVGFPAAHLNLHDVSLDMPVTFQAGATRNGSFTIGLINWRDQSWPGAAGEVAISDDTITASATWPALPGAVVNASANMLVTGEGVQGIVQANLPLFDASGSEIIGKLAPGHKDINLGGSIGASLRLPIGSRPGPPELTMIADRASLRHPEWAGSIESFSGSLTLSSISPLISLPEQRLSIHRALLGENEIVDATLIYTAESADAIAVHRASWDMQELGQFAAEPFRFDPARVRIATQVNAENMGLGPWLNLVSDGRIRGEGELQGSIRVEFEPQARQFIRFGAGFLYAGSKSGWIQTDDSETVQQILSQGDAALSSGGDARLAQVKDRIVAALQDYQYSLLRFHFIPETDGLLCKVETKGRGRGFDGQEIESLTINLHGFDSALRAALAGKSLWDLTD